MATRSVTISLNNSQRTIPFDQIPAVDAPMLTVLAEIHKKSPPPPSLATLSERVRDLSKISKLLEHANSHVARDRLLSILSTSLLGAFVAATTLGFIANPMIGVGILLLTLCYLLACHLSASTLGRKDNRKIRKILTMYPMGVLISPFVLTYLLFTRASRLQKKANAASAQIQTQALEAAIYWTSNGKQLAQKIVKDELVLTIAGFKRLMSRLKRRVEKRGLWPDED